jgi:hypothetical protein
MVVLTALHLRQKSLISSGPASACAPVGAPHTDSQCLPVSELLIISSLATAKPREEAEAEADSKRFDTDGTLNVPERLSSPYFGACVPEGGGVQYAEVALQVILHHDRNIGRQNQNNLSVPFFYAKAVHHTF